MAPTDEEPTGAGGNMQAFKRCVKCDGKFVVVASFEPGTEPSVQDVMCPHCGARSPTAIHGKVLGKIEVRKDRRQ
jgi:hypothetical protein